VEVQKILAELHQERDQIDEAILSLERLASGRHRGRGRPPKWMSEVKEAPRSSTREQEQAQNSYGMTVAAE